MTKEQIKELVREKLSSKKVILFGAGKVAEEFYNEYKDKLHITHCVSNYEKEWGEATFLGRLDVKKFCREEFREDEYIVVCGPIAFRTIELQLINEGFRMYEHFVESNIANAVCTGKRIALFYGQCILRDIYRCIIQVSAFDKEYVSVYTQTAKGQAVVTNRLLYHLKDICDLYVYTPKLLDHDSAYSLSVEELPPDCKVVSVSNLVVSLYWPQVETKIDVYNKLYLHSYNAERSLDFYHTLYRREDININRMVLEGKPAKEIVETLSSDGFYSEEEVKRNYKMALKLVDIAERAVNVKIADFIRENYQRGMLYQNAFHPNKCIIWEYVRRLLREIEISDEDVEKLEEGSPLHIHQSGDVPIYPSVAKCLHLHFVNKDTRYEILTGNGVVYMTFQEYTEHYIEYTRKVMEIMKMW